MRLLKKLQTWMFNPKPQAAPMAFERRHDMPQIPSGFEDVIKGFMYCATLQLRTPLQILREHRRFAGHTLSGPPVLSDQRWHGIWVPEVDDKFAILREGRTVASEVGPIPEDGGDYLPFLIAVRIITEGGGDLQAMEASLRALVQQLGPMGTSYSQFIAADELVSRALPRTIDALPVPTNVRKALLAAGLCKLDDIRHATDADLMAHKGLGAKSLGAIRRFLAETTLDPTTERYVADDFKPLRTIHGNS